MDSLPSSNLNIHGFVTFLIELIGGDLLDDDVLCRRVSESLVEMNGALFPHIAQDSTVPSLVRKALMLYGGRHALMQSPELLLVSEETVSAYRSMIATLRRNVVADDGEEEKEGEGESSASTSEQQQQLHVNLVAIADAMEMDLTALSERLETSRFSRLLEYFGDAVCLLLSAAAAEALKVPIDTEQSTHVQRMYERSFSAFSVATTTPALDSNDEDVPSVPPAEDRHAGEVELNQSVGKPSKEGENTTRAKRTRSEEEEGEKKKEMRRICVQHADGKQGTTPAGTEWITPGNFEEPLLIADTNAPSSFSHLRKRVFHVTIAGEETEKENREEEKEKKKEEERSDGLNRRIHFGRHDAPRRFLMHIGSDDVARDEIDTLEKQHALLSQQHGEEEERAAEKASKPFRDAHRKRTSSAARERINGLNDDYDDEGDGTDSVDISIRDSGILDVSLNDATHDVLGGATPIRSLPFVASTPNRPSIAPSANSKNTRSGGGGDSKRVVVRKFTWNASTTSFTLS